MKKIIVLFAALFALCTVAQAQELGYISVSTEVNQEVAPNFAQFQVTVEKFNVDKSEASLYFKRFPYFFSY